MKLRREPGTCFWCGDQRGPHPWKECPANGKSCSTCAGNGHFARVCLEEHNPQASGSNQRQQQARGKPQRSRRGYQRARASLRPRDVHYTDICEEQQYGSAPNPDYGFDLYALEAQVHNIDTDSPSKSPRKRYFTTLPLSTTGSSFKPVKFQIDTAATCNTMFYNTLQSVLPDAEIKRPPYLLYPYGNSKPLQPVGQVGLVCDKSDKYETLVFQILPDSCIGLKLHYSLEATVNSSD
ncbi:predicted protein [Nematostella vectensis]|uniref:CCHC-type domain-containing protein n=1 Tax=Nematostella vectensis TaxID=45351 RepID=A7S961_NEMVE|nr:predicted protein [Nematostella vectensis]|eukprot:XP_001631839.1 predicted protein [Nematostella vectensis]